MTITKEQVIALADAFAQATATFTLEHFYGTSKSYTAEKQREGNEARAALLEAVEQLAGKSAVSEPVAKVDANDDGYWADILPDRSVKVGQLLYAAPPAEAKREPLTDEKIKQLAAPLFMSHYWKLCNEFARAIEAAHGIVNIGAK